MKYDDQMCNIQCPSPPPGIKGDLWAGWRALLFIKTAKRVIMNLATNSYSLSYEGGSPDYSGGNSDYGKESCYGSNEVMHTALELSVLKFQ